LVTQDQGRCQGVATHDQHASRDRRSCWFETAADSSAHTQVAAERLAAPRDEDFFAYNLISISQADLERVREKLRTTFRELRSLVAASEPEEVAALINLQVVTFQAGPGPG